MTDFTTGEAPIEREPQATAVDVPAPATVGAAAAPPTDAPAAAPDIAYPVGSTPQLVLDTSLTAKGTSR